MAQLPPRNTALVDIMGTNSPRMRAQTVQGTQTPISQDITDQKFAESRQSVAKMYQDTVQGLTDVATSKSSSLTSRGRGQGAAEIAGLFESVATGVKVYQDVEAKRKVAEAEKAAGESKVAMTLANQSVRTAIQQKISDLNEAINTRVGGEGVNKIRLDIDQILAENKSRLDPKDYEELENLVVAARNSASDEYYTRIWNTQDELVKSEKAAQLATLTLRLSPMLGALKTARTPEEYQNGMTTIMEAAVEGTPGMTPMERSIFLTPLINQLAADSQASVATVTGIAQTQQDIDAAIPALEACNAQYGNDPNALSACNEKVRGQFPGASALITARKSDSEIRSFTLSTIKDQVALQQLAVESGDREMQRTAGDFRSATVQSLAWKLGQQDGNSRAERERIRSNPSATPIEKEALALAEINDKDQAALAKLNETILAQNAELESIAIKVDPTRLGDSTYLPASRDPITGALQPAVEIPGGAFIIRPTASRAQFDAAVAQAAETGRQRDDLIFNGQQRGVDLLNIRNPQFQVPVNRVLEHGRQLAAQQQPAPSLPGSQPPPGSSATTPNFNRVDGQGRVPTQPIVPLRRLQDGRRGDAQTDMISPISGVNAIITDGYGEPGNGENGRGRYHSGIDIASDHKGDIPVRAMTGGTVLHAANWGDNGYGGTVTVRSPSGHVEQYSHLRSFDVKPGQVIPPGTPLGLMGGGDNDVMAGGSSGRHIHLTIYRPDTTDGEVGYTSRTHSVDPIAYLKGIQYGNANNNSQQGLPPNQDFPEDGARNAYVQIPRSAIILPNGFAFSGNNLQGSVFSNNQLQILGVGGTGNANAKPGVPIQRVATSATPQVGGMVPINRNAFPSIGTKEDNYGYQELRDRPKLREAIHIIAKALDVPGMWVADIMNAESGFSRDIAGGDGGAYTGLIQMNSDFIARQGFSRSDFSSRDEVWQAQNIILPYWQAVATEGKGKYETIEDLYAAVLGGGAMYRAAPVDRDYGDSNAGFPQHMRRMGHAAGRRYRTTWEQGMQSSMPTHQLQDGDMPPVNGSWAMVG